MAALSDLKIKTAKPHDKPYKLTDGNGLCLIVNPNGGKWWRFRYRIGGQEKMLSLGTYPDVSLVEARCRCMAGRRLLSEGVDPGAERKTHSHEHRDTFKNIAREWHTKFISQWTEGHAKTIMSRLEKNVFPMLGGKSIRDITSPDVLAMLRVIEARGANESAHRVKIICGQVFRYAVATGRGDNDPTAVLRDALSPVNHRHFSAITNIDDLGGLLRAIDAYQGTYPVKCGLQLAPMVFTRPGELRQMEWAEVDLEAGLWEIPAEKMKMRQPHIVPLSRQAIVILESLRPFTSRSLFVFPSVRTDSRPMSNNAILSALRRMGYEKDEMSGHGFRAMARTILDEVLHFRPDYIEQQLAHVVKDSLRGAYNRTVHLPERIAMMQAWSDFLDTIKSGAKIIQFPVLATGTGG